MIYTTTVIRTRPNTNIEWADQSVWSPNVAIKAKSMVTSLNGLTCTTIFESNTIPEHPTTDWFELHQKTYRTQNGITRSVTVTDDLGNIVLTFQDT
jgi:hypothetical protein